MSLQLYDACLKNDRRLLLEVQATQGTQLRREQHGRCCSKGSTSSGCAPTGGSCRRTRSPGCGRGSGTSCASTTLTARGCWSSGRLSKKRISPSSSPRRPPSLSATGSRSGVLSTVARRERWLAGEIDDEELDVLGGRGVRAHDLALAEEDGEPDPGRRHGMTGSNGRQEARAPPRRPVAKQDDEIAMDEPVRLGLVGLGRMGRFHAANLAGRIPGARLVRVADAAEDVARENSVRLGGRGVVHPLRRHCLKTTRSRRSSLRARRRCTPRWSRRRPAAGKHVFCEKPISLDLERTYEVIEAVRDGGHQAAGRLPPAGSTPTTAPRGRRSPGATSGRCTSSAPLFGTCARPASTT